MATFISTKPYSIHRLTLRSALRPSFVTPARKHSTKTPQKSSWTHPTYTQEHVVAVVPAHLKPSTWQDRVALQKVRLLRWGMDFATGYKSGRKDASQLRMTEEKWLRRFIFLESVAGVPGMVAGMLRHLKSLRQMRRDNGWIETLLEEAYNERMHLLTFLQLAEPTPLMRFMVLGAQCVFFSGFSLAYLISPQICHRFVGYLEEEAVVTYSKAIRDLDNGKLPKWESLQAPTMAIRYWQMPADRQCMRSLLLYVRADEAKHCEVNHTLGDLDQNLDPNPYALQVKERLQQVSHGTQVSSVRGD